MYFRFQLLDVSERCEILSFQCTFQKQGELLWCAGKAGDVHSRDALSCLSIIVGLSAVSDGQQHDYRHTGLLFSRTGRLLGALLCQIRRDFWHREGFSS